MDSIPANPGRALGARMLKIAVGYLVLGMFAGIAMGATRQFQFTPVHAHMNLLGWATLAITGLAYQAYPELAQHWLASAHFWLHNVGLALMISGMTLIIAGNTALFAVAFAGALLATAGVLLFAINLWTRVPSR